MTRRMRQNKAEGFSLTELLVVIAAISVLIALLLPLRTREVIHTKNQWNKTAYRLTYFIKIKNLIALSE